MSTFDDDSDEYYRRAEELCRGVKERELPGPIAIPYKVEITVTKLVGVRIAQDFAELDKYRPWERRRPLPQRQIRGSPDCGGTALIT